MDSLPLFSNASDVLDLGVSMFDNDKSKLDQVIENSLSHNRNTSSDIFGLDNFRELSLDEDSRELSTTQNTRYDNDEREVRNDASQEFNKDSWSSIIL